MSASRAHPAAARVASAPERKSLSLATRMTVAFAISLVLLCAAISIVLDNAVSRGLDSQLDAAIDAEVRHATQIISGKGHPDEELRAHVREFSEAYTRPRIVVRILGPDGAPVAESKDAGQLFPEASLPPTDEADDVHGSEAHPKYLWTFRRSRATGPLGTFTVEVFGHQREVDRLVLHFRKNLVALVSPLMVAAIIAAYVLVRRTMAPLERVTLAAARIGSRTLGERLDVRRAPDEIARLAVSFNDMLDRLEDAFRRLTEFGADLAHELRTPIQNLRGEAEVALLKPRSQDEHRDILGNIVEECDRLARIVDDVLLLSRVERREEALDASSFDLATEVEQVREYFADVASARGIALAVSVPGALPVSGDPPKLRRAIANLVDNALKYTDAGGRVEITASARDDGHVEVLVSDTGRGIPKDHLPRVFERFYRVEKSRSREFGGSGLGLGIARTLVRAHGGDVTIESEVGKGTSVRIRLPKR